MGILIFIVCIVILMIASAIIFALSSRFSKPIKVILISLALLFSHFIIGFFTYFTQELDSNSYYSAAIGVLLDTTISGIENEDPNFLNELKEFKEKQILTYETRGDVLENLRKFRDKTISKHE